MPQHTDDSTRFGVQLVRSRDTPTRLALAALVGSDRFWTGFVVVLPTVLLLATRLHHVFVSFAAGVPVAICLWLQTMSHEFVAPCLTVDTETGTLTTSKSYDSGNTSTIDVSDLERVTVIRFANTALVRLHYSKWTVSKPVSATVPAARVPEFASQLERVGLDVSVREFDSLASASDMIRLRVFGTPIAVLGSFVGIWSLHGPEAFFTDAVVVPAVVLVIFAALSFVRRFRLRRAETSAV
ncbi:hypothetical protein [Haloferax mucosum]|uniref:hypothetical protein n=1 Tax=Haloferax mucosum TaxID=403181 RepID=UPI000677CC50|nr:hypothetical protein [Haloferax mucosum]